MIDPKAKDADTVALVQYLAADQKFEKVLDNQQILREPIVRNGRQATVGYEPDVWKAGNKVKRPRPWFYPRTRRLRKTSLVV